MFPRRPLSSNSGGGDGGGAWTGPLFSFITEGPFRRGLSPSNQHMHHHDNPLKNMRPLGQVMSIHSDRPSNPTQLACLPSELFGVILTFSGIQCLSLFACLNRSSFEKFENEDDLVYKILLQTLMKKDEAYIEQVRTTLGFTYKYSLKQLVRRANRVLGNGNYLLDTMHLSEEKEEEEEDGEENTTHAITTTTTQNDPLETKCELSTIKIPENERLSLTECTVEMNLYIGQPSYGTLIKLGNEHFTLSIEIEHSTLKLVENSNILAYQHLSLNTWTHIAFVTCSSSYDKDYYSLRFLANGMNIQTLHHLPLPSKDFTRVDFLTCWQNELRKPLIGKFTEIRIWNCSKQEDDIVKNIHGRLNPFVKSVHVDHLLLYFYPDLEDEDSALDGVKNKSPLKEMKNLENHLKISPNIRIRKIEARQAGFFDLCNLL
ncbi:hypothetical protein FDP41_007454 [Naegleria fowleri]|uniref:Uncharacterized protein n=1 Tax=Naegleria fowleri TaxID=5763 RepID=A0A6A5C4Q4_NAEFO|nr:uncharacterized protein FDP41_007454 [Naegleria fowleri]KAF0984277.1 hypothetical protein FDP41_007454 [Naegleria fowleri]CAG4707695.1 unnamed protein product [Naegleria fowleri]